MGENTKIAWAHHSFSPWQGCAKLSPACAHCYAETWAKRTGHPELWRGERRVTADATWRNPRRWNKTAEENGVSCRVFPSLCDPFDDHEALDAARVRFWRLVEETPHLTWLLLTKRPENALRMVPQEWLTRWPAHVWLGATVEDQQRADERIPHLLRCPAPVRFLSVEPMLGPVDLRSPLLSALASGDDPPLDWVIIGGESGPGARRMDPARATDLIAQCRRAGVATFFKQAGAVLAREMGLRDRAGADPGEWPPEWRVQQMPGGAT